MTDATGAAELRPLQIEVNGINVISGAERKGRPRDLFWPWFAANVSVFGLSYGSFILDFGISFWQAFVVGVVRIVVWSMLCPYTAVVPSWGGALDYILAAVLIGALALS